MKLYTRVATHPTPGDSSRVPNADRLTFRTLSNTHQYILPNRQPLTHAMGPSQQNGMSSLKTLESNPMAMSFQLHNTPCGDGDLCDWAWDIGNLSLNATQTPQAPTPSWYSSPTVGGPSTSLEKNNNETAKATKPHPVSLPIPPLNGHCCIDGVSKSSQEVSDLKSLLDFDLPSTAEFSLLEDNDDSYLHDHQKPQSTDKRLRSSSLKTNKTPPGTPGNKKIVRFADCLGLDLVDVKLFLDEIPNVPKSAFSDLQDAIDRREEEFVQRKNKANKLDRTLLPSFHQPVELGDFFDRLGSQKVLLENCFLLDTHQIKGCIRVRNLDFNKTVYLRYTYNDWMSFEEVQATYIPGSSDGFSDRFEFTLTLDANRTRVGSKFAFASRYECLGREFWDNNCGRNYVFHCVPSN